MDLDDVVAVGIAGAVLGVLFLVFWLGFKLLFLPLRLSWRFGRALAEHVGSISLLLVLIWTIALEPEPFAYLWGWFLRLGQALLVDAPRQFMVAISRLAPVCSGGSESVCFANLGKEAQQFWSTVIGQPISAFDVPPRLANAVFVFAAGVTLAFAVIRLPAAASGQDWRGDMPKIAALTASFLLALYLAIIAIVAIPEFGQKVPDLAPFRTNLADQLTKATPSNELKFPILLELAKERDELPDFVVLRRSLPNSGASVGASPFLDTIETFWASQLDLWNQSLKRIQEAAEALPQEARGFTQTAQSFFQVSNEGHIGETATQRHVTVLANSFNLWLSDYLASLDNCAARLREGLGRFRSFHITMVPFIRTMNSGDFTPQFDQINQAFSSFTVQRCESIKPVVRDYLFSRSGPAETLGPFGTAAGWLLRTESPELALIIGLLGFGFFGALAASFIREFAGTPGNQLPPVGFIIPALIRGIGAAILIFLLAKGGTAILTRGDATPNAYAIFFACFVAAVFSEDVWSWARTRQRDQLSPRTGQEPPGAGTHDEKDREQRSDEREQHFSARGPLQWAHDSDDEERDRREKQARELESGKDKDRGAEPQRGQRESADDTDSAPLRSFFQQIFNRLRPWNQRPARDVKGAD
jgi:hypothetical protein